jgi:Tfp pilus assembly protein PilF
VLTYEPSNFKALLRRATAYFKKKLLQKAKTELEKCVRIEPNDKKALVNLLKKKQ